MPGTGCICFQLLLVFWSLWLHSLVSEMHALFDEIGQLTWSIKNIPFVCLENFLGSVCSIRLNLNQKDSPTHCHYSSCYSHHPIAPVTQFHGQPFMPMRKHCPNHVWPRMWYASHHESLLLPSFSVLFQSCWYKWMYALYVCFIDPNNPFPELNC